MRALPRVKKVFIRSGIRYDYVMADPDSTFLKELCVHHVSGQLKVAPEHVCPYVLDLMGKPRREMYDAFTRKYKEINQQLGLKQYLIPYLMSSHPGSDLNAAIELACYLNDTGFYPEQVQDFYPTPGTLSTCMYYTGLDPRTMKTVYVAKDPREKEMQRALMQFRDPRNAVLVRKALQLAGREDLIGYEKFCLIKPENAYSGKHPTGRNINRQNTAQQKPSGSGNSKSHKTGIDRKKGHTSLQNKRHGTYITKAGKKHPQ